MSVSSWIDVNNLLNKRNVAAGLIGLLSFFSLSAIIKAVRKSMRTSRLEDVRKKTRSARDSKIDRFLYEHKHEVSKEKQMKILEVDVTELVKMIKSKKVTCEEVFITYAVRAGTVGKDLNLIAYVDFENGLKLAKEADKDIREGKELGALHGVPVSFYEQISIKGLLTTCGYTNYSNNINSQDSLIVRLLKKEGAIPFVKSNVPQGFFALEASNYLWGNAKNPWNTLRTTGGSNGGEAGLVAARCSPFGIGSDLFGSLRIPSSFCGVYGFKPTSSRTSTQGSILYKGSNFSEFNTFSSSYGPICRSMEDVLLISRNLLGKFEADVYVDNKAFDEDTYSSVIDNNNRPVRIGFFKDILDLPSSPAVKDTLDDLITFLKTNGYHLIEFPIDKFEEFIQVGMALLMNSDFTSLINRELNEEPMEEYHKNLSHLTTSSNLGLTFCSAFKSMTGNLREAKFISNFKNMSRGEYIDANRRYAELRSEFIKYWQENKFDAIISPVFPTTALEFGQMHKLLPYNHFAYIYNFADLPAVAVPIKMNKNTTYTDTYNDSLSEVIKSNMKTSDELPVSIQVGALPGRDEWVLRLAKEIDYFYKVPSS